MFSFFIYFAFPYENTLKPMTLKELNEAIKAKTAALEVAQEAGRPEAELLELYKELKELQYQKVQAELKASEQSH